MFIGSINRHMRAVLKAVAAGWEGLPVYVACSGNFTVERILAGCGVGRIHSNDVSIYSCALGWYLAGKSVQYKVRTEQEVFPDCKWLEDYLKPGIPTIATLLLAGEMLKVGGDNPYVRRIQGEYRLKWKGLHVKTVERIKKAIGEMSVATYFAGDCRIFLANADKDAICVSFPPTYKGGYERLFKKLDAIFEWPVPTYDLFSPEDFEQFGQTVRSFRHWIISSDSAQESLAGHHVATVQTSMLSKPVFMYCDDARAKLATPHQNIGKNPWAAHTGRVVDSVQIVCIEAKVMNAIRSMYLSQSIMVCDAPYNYAVLSAGKLLGCFSFSFTRGVSGLACDFYLLSDFAIRPSPHRRLSKLILACVVSKEVQAELEQKLCSRVKIIGTTAFTNNAVSMKYRGIFKVAGRSEGKVNYLGPAGKWTLKEGVKWWQLNHASK